MMASDRIAMEKWLAERAKDPHKELHYTGSGATVGDVERWMRALLKSKGPAEASPLPNAPYGASTSDSAGLETQYHSSSTLSELVALVAADMDKAGL